MASARTRILLVLAALALLVAGGAVWYLTRPAPSQVDIASAVEQADAVATGESAEGTDGTWTVDTGVGDFSVEDTTGTFVGFRVDEELVNLGAATAVGRTPAVTGSVELDGTTLTAATFEADLTQIVSNESRRNNAIQRALETAAFPTASFTVTEPIELGRIPAEGESVEVTAVGDLTIHAVTHTVEVPLQISVTNNVAVITGSLDVVFADYGVTAPTAPVVVSVEDHGVIELQLFLTH